MLLGLAAALRPGALAHSRTDTVAPAGQTAPGAGGGTFGSFSIPVLKASGQTAFFSNATGGASASGIVRSNSAGGLTVARCRDASCGPLRQSRGPRPPSVAWPDRGPDPTP